MPEFLDELIIAIISKPGQTGRFYARILRGNGFPHVTKREVNRALYYNQLIFWKQMRGEIPGWFLCNHDYEDLNSESAASTNIEPWADSCIFLEDLIMAVFKAPGLTGRNYARILRNNGFPWILKGDVNSILYGNPEVFFREVVDEIPAWFLQAEYEDKLLLFYEEENKEEEEFYFPFDIDENYDDDEEDFDDEYEDDYGEEYEPEYGSDDNAEWACEIGLYDWQLRALNAWKENQYRGVIEAVTGAGKTHVAITAMEAHLYIGWKVVVLVPSIALQIQWAQKVEKTINWELGNEYKIALMGGNHWPSSEWDILIVVANSAARYSLLPSDVKGLLIADECHRFGADSWSRGLGPEFSRRLGLTATFERSDNGLDRILMPYFGSQCYQLNYAEALDDDVIAQFKIAFIGVEFDDDEAEMYEEADGKCRKFRNKLINTHGLSPEPFGEFMKEVSRLSTGGWGDATFDARRYIKAFSDRRKMIAAARQKVHCLGELVPSIQEAGRTIIFTQTKHAAQKAVNSLVDLGINAQVLDATMTLDERQKVFAGFESGEDEVVAAPMLLDEGVDVPSADFAIILASSKSRRQMIQRMGRVLRKKEDGRLARVAILYVKDTAEDPEYGAHGTFIDLITEVAHDVQFFDALYEGEVICDYLNDWDS